MKKLISMAIAVCLSAIAIAQVPDKYEIQCAGNGAQGSYLVKVAYTAASKRPDDVKLQLAAVHGVMFRGFSSGDVGCVAQRPLCKNISVEQERADFFKQFFNKKKGQALGYAAVQSGSYLISKVKGGYKIEAIVTVNKDALRKNLEDAGIIKSLGAGF